MVKFQCENNKIKQAYLRQAFDAPYLFNDMAELGRGKGLDVKSGSTVDVPKVGMLKVLKGDCAPEVSSSVVPMFRCFLNSNRGQDMLTL